jgi:hypothetical protein
VSAVVELDLSGCIHSDAEAALLARLLRANALLDRWVGGSVSRSVGRSVGG